MYTIILHFCAFWHFYCILTFNILYQSLYNSYYNLNLLLLFKVLEKDKYILTYDVIYIV